MMLRGMTDSVLGVWVAHGEGEFLSCLNELSDFKLDNSLTNNQALFS